MDLSSALTLLGQATGIVKQIGEIDKSLDVASLRAQMANLYEKLADVRIALSDAKEAIQDKNKKIAEIEGRLLSAKSGEQCAICEVGRLKVVSSRSHEHLGVLGVQERTLKCDNCGYSEQRMHDPDLAILGRRG